MSQVYNMKGVLRGFNLSPDNGLPEGLSIERMKNGAPTGIVKFFTFTELGEHAADIREALSALKTGDNIDYRSQNYKPIKIGAPGTVYQLQGGGGGYGRLTPEDRRSIERQKALDITARVYETMVGEREAKTQKTFAEIMAEIREEAEKTAEWIRQE